MSCQKSWRACNNGALLGDEAYRFETCEDAQFITATRSGYADIVLVKVGQTTTIRGVKDFSDACRSLGFDRPGTSEGNSSCSLFYGAPLTGNQCNQGGHWQHYTLSQNFSGGIVLYMNLPTPADVTSGGTSGLYRYNMPARNAGQTLANDYNSCCGGSGATTSANLLAGDYLVCAVP